MNENGKKEALQL
ncbi:predicted coding region HP0429 [Helicobacter pylori 26695]|uniref:Uncharacterized protein n=4 Tax=Helicobacter pylori TaxID=210 RepID=O25179_HELPY|nr:predicted coding region HP0429 [Helicobacter pylori 26695]